MNYESNQLDRMYARLNPHQPETEKLKRMFPRSEWREGPIDHAVVINSNVVLFCLKTQESGPSISVLLDVFEARAIGLQLQEAASFAVGMGLVDMATGGNDQ